VGHRIDGEHIVGQIKAAEVTPPAQQYPSLASLRQRVQDKLR